MSKRAPGTIVKRPEIVLLDLNYTLIADQQASRYLRPIERRAALEKYRMDLVEALAGYRVILVTARPQAQRAATIDALQRRIPQLVLEGAYFNAHNESPPAAKRRVMVEAILPAGFAPASLFAVESNPATRKMYAELGVASAPYSRRLVERLRAANSDRS